MTVEWYALNLYDWERHNSDEKQSSDEINKVGSSLKIYGDGEGNFVHVLKSKNILELPEDILDVWDDNSIEMMKTLIQKEFYFCMVMKKDNSEPIFPDEIWVNFDAAKECCIKYL